ncbi:MAG TPA: Rne/Rng family ribonuclease, partial [Ilumatobacteraceae bacterium]
VVSSSGGAPASASQSSASEVGADDASPAAVAARKRRRGSRGGRGRSKSSTGMAGAGDVDGDEDDDDGDAVDQSPAAAADSGAAANGEPPVRKPRTPAQPRPAKAPPSRTVSAADGDPVRTDVARPEPVKAVAPRAPKAAPVELPERISEGRPSAEAAEGALVRRPQIGDTRPAPPRTPPPRGGAVAASNDAGDADSDSASAKKKRRRSSSRTTKPMSGSPSSSPASGGRGSAAQLDPDVLEKRRGRERNGRPIGRYLMCVQVRENLTQVAVMEGRNLVEHYVSRPADDISQIHGNIYIGKVQNVLPGMEAAFVDIGTPKNAVLYRGDVQYDQEDIVERGAGGNGKDARIEQILRAKQLIVCQVTKNPIGAKGARLTQEVSLPGRFVVLIPNSKTYGISKRLPDDVRKRLRNILDRVKPAEHGLIVRTAAENASEHELRADMTRLLEQWTMIEAKSKKMQTPGLLYREPELAVRVIREEFNAEYRGVVIDDKRLHDDVHDYIAAFNPELADRVEFYDPNEEGLPIYERFHLHEQLHKALDRKVWLPSGGSLIIEHTEALTVIDVNTGKNVGTSNSNLEATVFHNNLEAADEIARQLRLRDIGGIIVIDFIDMEIRENRRKVVEAFREALARDKTRTQIFDISELGLVEMTRKRIGEGLLTNFADQCPMCDGRGVLVDLKLLD